MRTIEGVGDIVDRREPIVGGFGQAATYDGRHVLTAPASISVEHRAEREDVGAVIDRPAPNLFWRHVSGGSADELHVPGG